jgi:hypothetical protein
MKRYGRLEVEFHHSSLRALDGCEWSASHPGRFIPGEIARSTHCIGRCLGQESVWTLWNREKSVASARNRTPIVQTRSPLPYRLSYTGSQPWSEEVIITSSCNSQSIVSRTALGQVFSEYFGFPCQIIPLISPLS